MHGSFQYAGINLGRWVSKQRSKKNQLGLEQIARLDALGFIWDVLTEQWEQGFAALEAYKNEFGNCFVPATARYAGIKLGVWVANQRTQSQLSEERIIRLDALGFSWNALEDQWEQGFAALEAYQNEFGNCLVPQGTQYAGMKLGNWVSGQRNRKSKLSAERIARLDALGFSWNTIKDRWEQGFSALEAYRNEFGNCLVHESFQYAGIKLGRWVSKQRNRKNLRSTEQIARLDALGFVWDPLTEQWEQGFSALEAYKNEFGNCLVPAKAEYAEMKLGNWVGTQRNLKNQLSTERIARLDGLGFSWDPLTEQWEEGFAALEAYKNEFGNCLVSQRAQYAGIKLGSWVTGQRGRKHQLSAERVTRLNALGFVWDQSTDQWEQGFSALEEYKNEFGNCLVPTGARYLGMRLGLWVGNQRNRKNRLNAEQIARLDALGFAWNKYTDQWEQCFSALKAYKNEFGNCVVPAGTQYLGKKLGVWVAGQRRRKYQLSKEQITRLDALDFSWDPDAQRWEQGFSALEAYKSEFGNCLVPKNAKYAGMHLGGWVSRQRQIRKQLSADRIARLDALGFVWRAG
ncbi:helicase associated domain-containing protein [Rhodospirillaceae bacterium]|nr:helicase associated domain-containing protein [Rhodospirillaceae bacterium]